MAFRDIVQNSRAWGIIFNVVRSGTGRDNLTPGGWRGDRSGRMDMIFGLEAGLGMEKNRGGVVGNVGKVLRV